VNAQRGAPSTQPARHRDPGRASERQLRRTLELIADGIDVGHSGSSLWDHLIGTYEILCRWGADVDVQLAGLSHSIYSTQYFRTRIASPTTRAKVAGVIGVSAERISHAFCRLDRQAIRDAAYPQTGRYASLAAHDGGLRVRVSRRMLRALRLVDLANEIELRQRQFMPPVPWLAWASAGFASIGFVPSQFTRTLKIDEGDEQRLLRYYQAALGKNKEGKRRALQACVGFVPRCAEPRILLAAFQLEHRDFQSAYLNARIGIGDLRGWGAAWDPRIPFSVWELLGVQVMEAARAASPRAPAIASQIARRLQSRAGRDMNLHLDPA
jgi:hypothetical protein